MVTAAEKVQAWARGDRTKKKTKENENRTKEKILNHEGHKGSRRNSFGGFSFVQLRVLRGCGFGSFDPNRGLDVLHRVIYTYGLP
jgi:hypothetical protein